MFPLNDSEEKAVMHLVDRYFNNPTSIKLDTQDADVLKILDATFKQKLRNIKTGENNA